MNEETINKIVEEHYGFTVEEIDNMVGNLSLKINQLEHNWNELKKYLELMKESGVPLRYAYAEQILFIMQELEDGGNNDC